MRHSPRNALPRADCVTVYSGATGYSFSLTALDSITLASDNVFGDNTATQLAAETIALSGGST